MPSNDAFRKYVEAGAALGQVTRARAEELMRELLSAGGSSRGQAQEFIDDLLERSRRMGDSLLEVVRAEVARQLSALGVTSVDDLAQQVGEVLRRSAETGRSATGAAASTAAATVTDIRAGATDHVGKAASSAKQAVVGVAGVGGVAAEQLGKTASSAKRAAATVADRVPGAPSTSSKKNTTKEDPGTGPSSTTSSGGPSVGDVASGEGPSTEGSV
jgi:polyhydroxyalkanoate synthesis regulator phasin